jgi:polyisoprenoid-binding protein YceI
LALASGARAEEWVADPSASRVVVHVWKKGVFSAFAHDHHFEVTSWRAAVDLARQGSRPRSVHVVLAADSLHDRQRSLSEKDRRKVDAQAAGPGVLDAEHHRTIEYAADRFDLRPGDDADRVRGTAHGTLTARGEAIPIDVAFEADRGAGAWRVRGSAGVKQTAIRIRPFSGFGGTVGVKDEVEIEFTLLLRPRSSAETDAR